MKDDLWLVLRPFGIHDPRTGRRDLRPGTVVNLAGKETASLERRGYIRLVARAAPLFTDSPNQASAPMKKRRN